MSMANFFHQPLAFEQPNYDSVLAYHEGRYRRWYDAYCLVVQSLGRRHGGIDLELLSLELFKFAVDTRNLWHAWTTLQQRGSAAPGPNGATWDDFSQAEMWQQLREISRVLQSGDYRHGRVRRIHIPKASGAGCRTICVSDIHDRVVARAVQQILAPWLRKQAGPLACCRFTGGVGRALALAERLAASRKLRVWGLQDLQNAFDQVPQQRLLQIVELHAPCERLVDLVRELIRSAGRRGVPQGSPLSPLLFEAYRSHVLDRRWDAAHPDVPLITYADDLLLVTQHADQTNRLYADLAEFAQAAGFRLKYPAAGMFVDVRDTQVTWLGFKCRCKNNRLVKRPAALSFDDDQERQGQLAELETRLRRLHHHPGAAFRARAFITGLLSHCGPGYPDTDRAAAYSLWVEAATNSGFDAMLTRRQFDQRWKAGFEKFRNNVRQAKKVFAPAPRDRERFSGVGAGADSDASDPPFDLDEDATVPSPRPQRV